MKNYFLYVFISLFLFSLSSCKDDKDVVAVLELGLENADFYKEAGSVVIDVKSLPADWTCLLYTSPSPRDRQKSRMPSSA